MWGTMPTSHSTQKMVSSSPCLRFVVSLNNDHYIFCLVEVGEEKNEHAIDRTRSPGEFFGRYGIQDLGG